MTDRIPTADSADGFVGDLASRPPSPSPSVHRSFAADARRSLLPFLGVMVLANLVLHGVIVATGNYLGFLSGVLLATIAIGYAAYLIVQRRGLGQLRYGRLVAHMITFAVVNTGFQLHAYLLLATGSPAITGRDGFPLDPQWVGATLGMAGLWGLGLVMHLAGSLLDRGYEAAAA